MAKAAEVKPEQTAEDELFSEKGSLRFPYFKFENTGDRVYGIYVGKFQAVSSLYGHTQENYILLKDDGSKVLVAGRNARKEDGVKIMYNMDKVPLGGKCGFIFTGVKDTGKGNPCKLVEARYLGDKDMDTYNKFKEMYNLDEVKSASTDEATTEEAAGEPEL